MDGAEDKHSLIVQGWERAGALIPFFSAPTNAPIQQPTYLYASAPASSSDASNRPLETITPLGARLNITPDTSFAVGSETQLVDDVKGRSDTAILIAWEHKHIPLIGNAILGNSTTVPQTWPDDRFDVVFVFDLQPSGSYDFSQVPQMLLAGDSPELI
jgi:hypothetical protein